MALMRDTLRLSGARLRLVVLLGVAPALGAAQVTDGVLTSFAAATRAGFHAVVTDVYPRESYAGRDERGVPRYLARPFTADERRLLRRHFGIEEPGRLYLYDTTPGAPLVYDTELDSGDEHLVRSYRVGAPSVRRAGETWEALERRLATMRPSDFPPSAAEVDSALTSLDGEARPAFERMLAAARRAGHEVRVTETRRSPERQAYLVVSGGGLTFTATSMHSSGRAIDVAVGDGNLRKRSTRAKWAAFRRWVAAYQDGRFRLIGTPEESWDWPHLELPDTLGYRSIEELLAAAGTLEATP